MFWKKKKTEPEPRFYYKYVAIPTGNEPIEKALSRETWTCKERFELYAVMSNPDRILFRERVEY